MRPWQFIKWTLVVVILGLTIYSTYLFFGHPSFSPNKVARAETRMWRAYYGNRKKDLGFELVTQLRNQFGLSFLEAKSVGELLANAAMQFRSSKADYEKLCLSDLTKAYTLLKAASGAHFDPKEVAEAELSWWVARRTAGQNSPEEVGKRIAHLYALLYGGEKPEFRQAGLLRAQAGALRDAGGHKPDWKQVELLLTESYKELKKGM